MRKFTVMALVAVVVLSMAASVSAITWESLAATTATNGGDAFTDANRIVVSAMAIDNEGHIFVAANTGTFATDGSGSLVVFTPSGSSYTATEYNLQTLGFTGAITKLVVGGDGNVYALQNYTQIEYDSDAMHMPNRILKVDLTPASGHNVIEKLWCLDPANNGCPTDQLAVARIGGMALGEDGNIYWTSSGKGTYYDGAFNWAMRSKFFWRYDTGTGSQVAQAPINTSNNGFSSTHRLFDLEATESGLFAVIGAENQVAGNLAADMMGWEQNRAPSAVVDTWGHDWVTATAYDKTNHVLWAGTRGKSSPWCAKWISGAPGYWMTGWMTKDGNGSYIGKHWYSIADLGGGNKALRWNKPASDTDYSSCRIDFPSTATAWTIGARLKVASVSTDYHGNILSMRLHSYGGVNQPSARVRIMPGTSVYRFYVPGILVGDDVSLGSIAVDGNFHEFQVSYDAATSTYNAWIDGTQTATNVVVDVAKAWHYYGDARIQFGSSPSDSGGSDTTGAVDVYYDWVGMSDVAQAPTTAWPDKLGMYMDGSIDFDGYYRTCKMGRFTGGPIFGASTAIFADGVNIDDAAPNNPRGVNPWVQALAVDPVGNAWYSMGAGTDYRSSSSLDQVMKCAWDSDTPSSLGAVESGARVVAMTFKNATPYVVTTQPGGGVYKVFKGSGVTGAIGNIKANGAAGDIVATDGPKTVTYVYDDYADPTKSFFYIQDKQYDAPYAGIRVNLSKGTLPAIGDEVGVEGILAVHNGEAQIDGGCIVGTPTLGSAKAVYTLIKNLGGAALGIQPAITDPAVGAHNIGSLVRVSGTVMASVDDVAPFFTLQDGSTETSTQYYYEGLHTVPGIKVYDPFAVSGYSVSVNDNIAVTGVLAVDAVDTDNDGNVDAYQRVILINQSFDITPL